MVTVYPGVWCDPCIAPLVKALNECEDLPAVPSKHNPDGIRTLASCCGHGKQPAHIVLADDREVFVADPEWAEAIWAAIIKRRDGAQRSTEIALCPLCSATTLWALSSKGEPEAFDPEPSADGYVHIQEGFAHVYFDGHEVAVENLLAQGFRPDQIRLYERHFCGTYLS